MNVKRLITAIVGLPIVILLIVLGNIYVMDVVIAAIAILATYEYSNCIKGEAKFIAWVGYLVPLCISFTHIVPANFLNLWVTLQVPIILFLLFFTVIITNMKYNFKDLAFSFAGILYISVFMFFLTLIYAYDGNIKGKILIWFVLTTSWGTDAVAYLIGKKFGKHKFSAVSPNKSIEGCIAGIFGAILLSEIAVLVMNYFIGTEISYLTIAILSIILSIIGQVGDFSASSIKRYFEIKDFSELFPGHGGMIDRLDSVMFIAPFAYFLLTMFL